MGKKNSTTTNGTFDFNVSDDKAEYGAIKSMTFTPKNATGEFRVVGPERWLFAERTAAFNAISRYYFEQDELLGPVHLYAQHNSRRMDGGLGWINLFELQQSGDFDLYSSKDLTKVLTLKNGQKLFVEWATRTHYVAEDGRIYENEPAVIKTKPVRVTVMGTMPWARLVSNGPNRAKVVIEQANKWGKYPGDLLHSRLAELASGARITVATTNRKFYPDLNNREEFVWLDSQQRKAAWLHRSLTVDGYDYEAHKSQWVEDRLNAAATFGLKKQLEDQNGEVSFEEAKEVLEDRAKGQDIGITITVDGQAVDIAKVTPGYYRVFDSRGKLVRAKVSIARLTGASMLRSMARGRNTLEKVSDF